MPVHQVLLLGGAAPVAARPAVAKPVAARPAPARPVPVTAPTKDKNKALGFKLATMLQQIRKVVKNSRGQNGATGALYITDGEGTRFFDEFFSWNGKNDGRLYLSDDKKGHSEKQMLEQFSESDILRINIVMSLVAKMRGKAILHIVLFTQLAPCKGCRGQADAALSKEEQALNAEK